MSRTAKFKPVDTKLIEKQLEMERQYNAQMQTQQNVVSQTSTRSSQVEKIIQTTLGVNLETLENFYKVKKDYLTRPQYRVGEDPDNFTDLIKSRANKNSIAYIRDRSQVLSELVKAFSLQNPSHISSLFEMIEKAHQRHNSPDAKPFHYIEVIEAAKKAVKGKKELAKLLEQDPSFILYNKDIRELTAEELLRRSREVDKIHEKSEKYSHRGFFGRLADFGVSNSLAASGGLGLIFGAGRYGNGIRIGNGTREAIFAKDGVERGFRQLTRDERFYSKSAKGFARFVNGGSYSKSLMNSSGMMKSLDSYKKIFLQKHFNDIAKNGHTMIKGIKVSGFDDYMTKIALPEYMTKLGSKTPARAVFGKTFLPRALAIGKQIARKSPYIAAALALGSWLTFKVKDNPAWKETFDNTVGFVAKTARDWALPDFGILFGKPWFEGATA